jgi:hypothetical protein
LTTVAPLRALISDFAALLAMPADAAATTRIERVPAIGRPLGRPEWIAMARAPALPAFWHPANPVQNREWSRTPRDQRSCREP